MMVTMSYCIIVLSENKTVLAQLCEKLSAYPVKIIHSGQGDLIDQVLDISPDVILVDSTFGKLQQTRDTCQLLQSKMHSHRIAIPPVLSVIEGNSRQRGEVLCSGAVDCVNYPFHAREVMMRIEYSLLLLTACHQGLIPYRVNPGFHALCSDRSKYSGLAKQTADYLEKNLAVPLTLNQLAQAMNTNRNRLSAVFKQVFGQTVFQWLYHRRMDKAAEYLLRTNFDIQQIAYQVGYTDANNFSTAFKKRFHCSPSAYRMQEHGLPIRNKH